MGWLDKVLRRNSELESLFDLDLTQEIDHRYYLKQIALETNINFIARTISQSEFRFMKGREKQLNDWHYLLNVRPNKNQSATDFWQDFTYKLIDENEVLVILSDSNDFLIADDFERTEYAVFSDVFSNVTVDDYTFKRTFRMDEVIHIDYNNEKLTKFTDGMFKDFSDLFSRMMEVSLRNNQIRGTVGLDTNQNLDEENQKKLQGFIDKLFQSFRNNSIALVPKLKGFEYEEVSKGDRANSGQSIDEIHKLKRKLIDDVAEILGIPSTLVHGDLSDYETAIKAYIKFCIGPLIKKISDELNSKLIEKEDYLKGERIEVRGVVEKSVIENAEAVDKLVASGAYTRNEVREKFGDERSDDPELDKFVITKNYQSADDVEKPKPDTKKIISKGVRMSESNKHGRFL